MTSLRTQMRYLNPYDLHKLIINDYVLKKPGDTRLLKRDTSKDRNDYHVIKENHKFLWDNDETPKSWELQFAKKYYDKLFKEYCIGDLTLYKENKIALRWRTEKEVIVGKGQFICGNKKCEEKEDLRTWEVNFAYIEQGNKKNALVKIRLCPECSKKLNYHNKKKEVKRLQRKSLRQKINKNTQELNRTDSPSTSTKSLHPDKQDTEKYDESNIVPTDDLESPWDSHKPLETKSREEEMEDYLQDLLL
ncbi:protein FRA10AC1 [Anoplophora glabripennis]|uniref:protein FRA10AC1 n=1 Tax=Anoplophora glabripennis TaxID=217634 RepID=UPI0008740833|nr:protein FRA10AC1 [Anoplophora glabripennis]